MTSRALKLWMTRHGYSASELAGELSVGRRTVFRWRGGETPIPKTVELALEALATRQKSKAK